MDELKLWNRNQRQRQQMSRGHRPHRRRTGRDAESPTQGKLAAAEEGGRELSDRRPVTGTGWGEPRHGADCRGRGGDLEKKKQELKQKNEEGRATGQAAARAKTQEEEGRGFLTFSVSLYSSIGSGGRRGPGWAVRKNKGLKDLAFNWES